MKEAVILALLFTFSLVYGKDIPVNATESLGDAITQAENGDVLVFAYGTYHVASPGYNLVGRNLTFTSASGNPYDVNITTNWGEFAAFYAVHIDGGATNSNTTLSFSGLRFVKCGGRYVEEDAAISPLVIITQQTGSCTLTINNCIFEENINFDGGVIFAEEVDGDISISVNNSIFNDNEAILGGVFWLVGGNLTIENSTFTDNAAIQSDDSAGGVLFTQMANIVIRDSHFTGNGADDDGGVILATYPSSLTIVDSSFVNNAALDEGGAIFVQYGPVNIVASEFDFNWAYNSGALFVAGLGAEATLDGCFFNGNFANGSGGAIVVFQDAKLTLFDSTLANNTAFQGGAIDVEDAATAQLVSVTITGNQADSGGAFYVDGGSVVSVQHSAISGNGATSAGANLYCSGSNFSLVETTFTSVINSNDVNGVWCDNSTKANSCDITSDTTNLANSCVDHSSHSSNNHMAGWKIALIVIFVLVGVALIVGAVIFVVKKKKAGSESFSRM